MKFSATELAQFKATQVAHMMDKCVVLAYGATIDTYGNATDSYTAGDALACGFGAVGGSPASGEALQSSDVPISTHALRIPHGTAITSLDRVRITERFGVVEASPIEYEVVGPIQSGPSGLVVKLKRVTE